MMIFQYSNNPGLINSQKEKFNSINLLNLLERFPSAPLPIVGVFDGVEAGRRQGHPVRGRLRHGARESLGCQIALLLLALVQSQPLRPQGRPRQIRQCVRQISSNIEILHNIEYCVSISADDLAPFVCQRDSCPNAGSAEAGKVCYDHRISITFASETPPPMYLCIECANEIHRSHPNQMFYDILHPMQQVSMICENKVSLFKISFLEIF